MRQIVLSPGRYPDDLRVVDVAPPAPKPGELRIRVRASGVNFADVLARRGLYCNAPTAPYVPGYEVAGVVDAVGPGVDEARVGQRVWALCRFGGYSELVCVPAADALLVPAGWSCEAAAAFPVSFLTVWHVLAERAQVRPRERVLVLSAGGGLGMAAVQLVRAMGAIPFGVASRWKHQALLGWGYEATWSPSELESITNPTPAFEVIVDPQGGSLSRALHRRLTEGGRHLLLGSQHRIGGHATRSAEPLQFSADELMERNTAVLGVSFGPLLFGQAERTRARIRTVLEQVAAHGLTPRVHRVYPLSDAALALEELQQRRNLGKVLLGEV